MHHITFAPSIVISGTLYCFASTSAASTSSSLMSGVHTIASILQLSMIHSPIFPNSFISSTTSIAHVGAKPVFADVLAATTGNGLDGVQLDVRDYGTISASEVIKFRK